MDYLFFICKIAYILLCLPSHQCEVCGTLRALNTDHITQGDDVRLEFSYIRSYDTSLVRWVKNRTITIDTSLQRFSIVVQPRVVTLIISNVTAEDSGWYTADFGSIQCIPPRDVLVTVIGNHIQDQPKVLSINPQFPDNVNIPELDCAHCLVGTVGVYYNVECIVSGISGKNMDMELKLKKNDKVVPNVTVEDFPFYRAFYGYMPNKEDTDHLITCEATSDDQQRKIATITLVILRKPSIPTITLPDSIKEGKHANISCKTFNARPEPRLYFMYNSTTYNTTNSFSKAKGDKTVDAETILGKYYSRYDNTRSLECCVEFKEYHKNTQNMKTYCATSAISILFPPKFLQLEELKKTNDAEGNTSLLLQCTSDVSNPILSANLTRKNNGGLLSCYIENPEFPDIKVIKTYELNITYKPFISFSPSSQVTIYVDDSISVLCQCDANPAAKVEWSNTSANNIGKRTEVSLALNMQFKSTGRHNFTCIARNTIGSAVNEVFILVKEKATEPTKPIPSTGKVISYTMLIGIVCGFLAVVIIVIIAFVCVMVLKTRKKTRTRERPNRTHNQERQQSFQTLDPDHNDSACSNPGYGPSEAIAEPVEYTCVVKRAVRQAPKPQTEEGALIYADLDLPAEGSTRRKPTVNSDAETTYVSIDFAQTKKMKTSVLDD